MLKTMRPSAFFRTTRVWLSLLLPAVFLRWRAGSRQSHLPITLTPAVVVAGSPELIHVDAPAAARSTASGWAGSSSSFADAMGTRWFALAGVDVEGAVGPFYSADRCSDSKERQSARPEPHCRDSCRALPDRAR